MERRRKKTENDHPNGKLKRHTVHRGPNVGGGGGYNALSGRGTVIGVNTGKCIGYGMKKKYCRTCLIAEKKVKSHRSMIIVKLFRAQQKQWKLRSAKTYLRLIASLATVHSYCA